MKNSKPSNFENLKNTNFTFSSSISIHTLEACACLQLIESILNISSEVIFSGVVDECV